MENKKGKKPMKTIILIVALVVLAVAGCIIVVKILQDRGVQPVTKPSHISGGTTRKNDPTAPKEIKSKNITEFSAHFLLGGEWSVGNDTCFYSFDIQADEAGNVTVTESTTGASMPADNEILTAVQGVIDKYKLVGLNGEYEVTAGLPPEYQTCYLSAVYDSGEKLNFTHNNNPHAEWAKEMYLTFADWFSKNGNDALALPTFAINVTHMQMFIKQDKSSDNVINFFMEEYDDGVFYLERMNSGKIDKVPIEDKESFLNDISLIVAKYDLRPYDPRSALYGYEKTDEDKQNPFNTDFALTFWYGDNEQLFINTSAPEAIEKLMPIANELIEYLSSYF